MADTSNPDIEISAISDAHQLTAENEESREIFEEGQTREFGGSEVLEDGPSKETGGARSSVLSTQNITPILQDRLKHDMVFLANNQVPRDSSGLKLDCLDYRGGNEILTDEDALALAQAFKKNTVYAGELLLSRNALTDQGVLFVCDSTAHLNITKLDLSNNPLKARAGIQFGEFLKSNKTLKGLYFHGAHMEKDGVQRLCESLMYNDVLVALDLGVIQSTGLQALGKYLKKNSTLKHLWIEEDPRFKWTTEAKGKLLETLRENSTLLSMTTKTTFHEAHVDLMGEVNAICEYNREQYLKIAERGDRGQNIDPLVYGLKLKKLSEHRGSAQNLPVRSYLRNAIGPLIIDAIVELDRYRRKEGAEEENNAVNNVRFIAKYLIERKHEKFQ
mmetsp:Transcript_61678/g.70743  ORF Transcript_61678/g.70743 Transcript_61678/m.70743 type:complete len:389 (+) Transcript_61678:32-1198(+)